MRTLDAAGLAPARTQIQVGDVDAAIAGAAHTVTAELRLPLPGPHADRPELRGRRRDRDRCARCSANMQDAYGMRVNLAALLGLPREPDQGAVLGGREHVRQQPGPVRRGRGGRGDVAARRRARCGSSSCAGTSTAGTTTARRSSSDMRGGVDGDGQPRRARLHGATASRRSRCGRTRRRRTRASRSRRPASAGPTRSTRARSTRSRIAVSAPSRCSSGTRSSRRPRCARRTARRRASPPSSSSTSSRTRRGIDPYEFRLQNIATAQVNDGFGQWRDALVGAARLAGWQPRVAASSLSKDERRLGPRDRDRRVRELAGRRWWPTSR